MYNIEVTLGSASWTKEWPTEVGYYWFYGEEFKGGGNKLYMVKVYQNSDNGSIHYYVQHVFGYNEITPKWGYVLEQFDTHDGYWFPIYTPDVDELEQNLKD